MALVMPQLLEWVVYILCPQRPRKSLCCGDNDFQIGSVETCLATQTLRGLLPTVILNWQVPLLRMTFSPRRPTYEKKQHTTRTIMLLQFTGKEKGLPRRLVQQLSCFAYKLFTKDSFVMFLCEIIYRDRSMSWQIFSPDVGISQMNKFCLTLIYTFHR